MPHSRPNSSSRAPFSTSMIMGGRVNSLWITFLGELSQWRLAPRSKPVEAKKEGVRKGNRSQWLRGRILKIEDQHVKGRKNRDILLMVQKFLHPGMVLKPCKSWGISTTFPLNWWVDPGFLKHRRRIMNPLPEAMRTWIGFTFLHWPRLGVRQAKDLYPSSWKIP